MSDVLGQALALRGAGCSVIRAAADGTKAPLGTWKQWQSERPGEQQLHAWLDGGYPGIGIVCGAVSGNLDMLEFEGRAVTEGLFTAAAELAAAAGLGDIWGRLVNGYMECSPSGGVHFCYRIDGAPVPGNTKLAERPARDEELTAEERARIAERAAKGHQWRPSRTLIETRGEGGFVVVAPSHGPVHPSGHPWVLASGGAGTIPVLTAAERKELLRVIQSLDQMPREAPKAAGFTQPGRHRRDPGDGKLPGEDYNERADWETDILGPRGWTVVAALRDGTRNWRRPGKKLGMSATTGRPPYDNLYVFSTSTEFDHMKPYTKFGAYALLDHGGDYGAASAQLRREGYGDDPEPSRPKVYAETKKEERRKNSRTVAVPSADPAMYAGLLGEIAAAAAPTTEADPVGIYASLLAGVGVIIGRSPYVQVGNTKHPLLIWPLLLGRTGSGRKGEATSTAEIFLRNAAPTSPEYTVSGLSSGEGLIERIRDEADGKDGIAEKRLLVVETEFSSVMARAKREGSTLAAVQRQAWDGRGLTVLNRKALRASTSHVAIIGHITPMEFRLRLAETDMAGGTYNRYLPLFVERPHLLAIPEGVADATVRALSSKLYDRIHAAADVARISLGREARQLWTAELYPEMTACDDEDQAYAEFTRRSAPYCLRIAGLLAVLDDGRDVIGKDDLAAAGALVRYAIASARYVLDRQARDPRLDRIRRAVDAAGEQGLSRTEVSALFSRNLTKEVLEELLAQLTDDDEYEESHTATRGRPALMYRRVLSSSFVPGDSQ